MIDAEKGHLSLMLGLSAAAHDLANTAKGLERLKTANEPQTRRVEKLQEELARLAQTIFSDMAELQCDAWGDSGDCAHCGGDAQTGHLPSCTKGTEAPR